MGDILYTECKHERCVRVPVIWDNQKHEIYRYYEHCLDCENFEIIDIDKDGNSIKRINELLEKVVRTALSQGTENCTKLNPYKLGEPGMWTHEETIEFPCPNSHCDKCPHHLCLVCGMELHG
jgi:hypothetical protein